MTRIPFCVVVALFGVLESANGHQPEFRRGDVNGDNQFDVADPVMTLSLLFLDGERPVCLDAADTNDDGVVDLVDAVFELWFLFVGTVEPSYPFPECGGDPTDDSLPCEGNAEGCNCVSPWELVELMYFYSDLGCVREVAFLAGDFSVTVCPANLTGECRDTPACEIYPEDIEARLSPDLSILTVRQVLRTEEGLIVTVEPLEGERVCSVDSTIEFEVEVPIDAVTIADGRIDIREVGEAMLVGSACSIELEGDAASCPELELVSGKLCAFLRDELFSNFRRALDELDGAKICPGL